MFVLAYVHKTERGHMDNDASYGVWWLVLVQFSLLYCFRTELHAPANGA